jgi:hypothetical protein
MGVDRMRAYDMGRTLIIAVALLFGLACKRSQPEPVDVAGNSTAAVVLPGCTEPTLSDDAVVAIIASERAARTDLPPAYESGTVTVRRKGCHYTYSEELDPQLFHSARIFTLNQRGVIVEVLAHGGSFDIECPGSELTDAQVIEIVRVARETRTELPPPFESFETDVGPDACLKLYTEESTSEPLDVFNVFVIDPFGEIVDAYNDSDSTGE